MLGMGLGLIFISACSSYHCVLSMVCLSAAGHGFYQSTILMNPSDLAPNHTGLIFGEFVLSSTFCLLKMATSKNGYGV